MTNLSRSAEARQIISQACTDAIAALVPAGSYPLDIAIIDKALSKLEALLAETDRSRIDELESLLDDIRHGRKGGISTLISRLEDRLAELKKEQ